MEPSRSLGRLKSWQLCCSRVAEQNLTSGPHRTILERLGGVQREGEQEELDPSLILYRPFKEVQGELLRGERSRTLAQVLLLVPFLDADTKYPTKVT